MADQELQQLNVNILPCVDILPARREEQAEQQQEQQAEQQQEQQAEQQQEQQAEQQQEQQAEEQQEQQAEEQQEQQAEQQQEQQAEEQQEQQVPEDDQQQQQQELDDGCHKGTEVDKQKMGEVMQKLSSMLGDMKMEILRPVIQQLEVERNESKQEILKLEEEVTQLKKLVETLNNST